MKRVVVYLHGFNSSAQALKAKETAAYLQTLHSAIDFKQPTIPDVPDEAVQFLNAYIEDLQKQYDDIVLIGSSLGGFYATWLAEKFDLRAVLVNPAIKPHELMHKYLGCNENPYTHVRYELTASHMQTLQSLYKDHIHRPQRFLILLQMADEVLDATDASARFYQSACRIDPAGDHRFQDFKKSLPMIFDWLLNH